MSYVFLERVSLTLVLTVALLLSLRMAQRALRRASASVVDANAAHRLYAVGQLFAVSWVASSVVHQCARGEDWQRDVLWSAAYGVVALVAQGGHGLAGDFTMDDQGFARPRRARAHGS